MVFREYNSLWDKVCAKLEVIPELGYLDKILRCFEILDIKNNTITIFTNFYSIYSIIDNDLVNKIDNAIKDVFDNDSINIVYQSNFTQDIAYDPNKNLDNFKLNSENRLAIAVAKDICSNNSNKIYSPLFLFSDTGMGKTHLANAIALEYSKVFPHKKIAFYTGESFINAFFEAVKRDSAKEWKENNVDSELFIVDNIQILENNDNAINEFYSLFDALYSAKHKPQIIITSNKKPNSLHGFPESLKSRLQWGVKIEIQSPNKTTKESIINSIFNKYHITIDSKNSAYIAKNYNGNIRELEGVIKTIFTHSTLLNEDINENLIDKVLGKNEVKYEHSITGEDILYNVCRYFNITEEEIKSKKRTRAVAFPRQIGMYITKQLTNTSLQETGKIYGGRDHSTVKHSNDKILKLRNTDAKVNNIINTIIKLINNHEIHH